MCLLIDNSLGKEIPLGIILNAAEGNPHGYGRLCLATGKVKRTMDMKHAVKLASQPGPAIHHFRFATVGSKCVDNAHPALVASGWYLFQNGTVSGFTDRVRTDTQSMAELLKMAPEKNWPAMLEHFDSRFAVVNAETKAVIRTGEGWVERDGVWYSNSYHFKADHLVAVYGTLKSGNGNNHLLDGSKFIGWGYTNARHRLCFRGLPMLIEGGDQGKFVEVEVYAVDDETLKDLDRLEGHPGNYERRMIAVDLEGDEQVRAWVYFAPEYCDTGAYLDCYGESWVEFMATKASHAQVEDGPTSSGLTCPECGSTAVTEEEGYIACENCYHWTVDGMEYLWHDGPPADIEEDGPNTGSMIDN